MHATQITKGHFYKAQISGRVVTVRVDNISQHTRPGRVKTFYHVTNMTTNRTTSFRSARKFIRSAVDPAVERAEKLDQERALAEKVKAHNIAISKTHRFDPLTGMMVPVTEPDDTQKALAAGAEDLGSALGYHDPFKMTPDEKLDNRATAEHILDLLMGGDWMV